MRVLVTGSAGFVGSHLVARLRADDHEVTGLDSLTDYYDMLLKRSNVEASVRLGADFVHGDLNSVDLVQLLDGIDVVFHLAGQPGVRSSWGSEFSTYTRCNVDATQKLLEAAKISPSLKRVVYASSSSIYGNAERYPTTELDRPLPVSPYGVTKLAAEHLCTLYAACFGVPTVSLRYFTVYGPRQRPDMAFTRFAMAALQDSAITIYGDGEQIRDFTFVDDVVEANVLAASREVPPGTVLNVAGGSHTSVNEVLEVFQEISQKTLTITRVPSIAGDVHMTGGDTTAILSLLGWEPTVGLREGISRQFDWARNSLRS
ncbi:nucleoside-diphosphate-sugar epimerase [Mycobacterium sp. BK558]|nr:nucleoside-diphosphate-sugar epimerase [Mycobacterium sp. BK558]